MQRTSSTGTDYRPSYLAAAITSVIVFLLYAVTLAPSTAMWDASEYIAAAYVLGIPHPPGNPLFVLLGRVASVLPIAPSVAMRINLLAALCSAASAGMWFLITERVLVSWLSERWQRIAAGAAAALIGATAFTVWNQSVVNEKVYTVSLVFFAVVSWLVVRWCDDPDAPGADRLLVLAAFLIGLGYANHPAGFLVAPAAGLAVLVRRPTVLLRGRLILACVLALGLGLTPFLHQPIRAAHFPSMNMGEPTGCTESIGVGCTFSATTYHRLKANITREQYGKPSLTERQAPFIAQLGMWWLYFEWQWMRDAYLERPGLQRMLALLFLALGLAGGWVHWQRDRRSFWFFAPLIGTVTIALVFYMNFKYGFSQAGHLGSSVAREVRDRDYFYLWSFSAWSVWAALGLTLLWSAAATAIAGIGSGAQTDARPGRPNGRATAVPHRRAWLLAAPVLAIALIPLIGNRSQAPRAGETATRDWAYDLLNSVEPYGILITGGDNDTFPLWYAQEVEGIRRDVTVAVTSLLNTDWYVRQIVRRPVIPYDSERGPAIYRDRDWTVPTGPALRMTIAEADLIPPYYAIPGTVRFQHQGLSADIDPRRLQYGVLERSDLIVLQMLRDNLGERPIYISRSSGAYGEMLGLGDYLLTQGLARKVMPVVPQAPRDTMRVQHEGWVDLPRTRALWEEVYLGPESLIAQDGWVDRASLSTPVTYITTGLLLSQLLALRGDEAAGQRISDTALRVARSARIGDWFGAPRLDSPVPGDVREGVQPP
ncbi:MAG TPA: DUF2723 domain-containing protein [Gemmatimonadaceae bacterium]|nr:DUF2723 domain-containing protein [Gemmatimonadaceae bacterium]